MEKWWLWSEAKGVGMVEPMEKTGPLSPTVSRRRRLRRGRGHLARPGTRARTGSTRAGLPAGTAIPVQDAWAAERGPQVRLVGSLEAPRTSPPSVLQITSRHRFEFSRRKTGRPPGEKKQAAATSKPLKGSRQRGEREKSSHQPNHLCLLPLPTYLAHPTSPRCLGLEICGRRTVTT